jgi:hypothetical protein
VISAEVELEHRVDHFKGEQHRLDNKAGQEVNYTTDRGQIHPNHIYRIGRKWGFKQKVKEGIAVEYIIPSEELFTFYTDGTIQT